MWRVFNKSAVVGQDIPAVVVLGIVFVAWPSLWVGTRSQACQKFGKIYG
jgi:hypothetical protein